MKLEYVVSGTSYMRLSNPTVANNPNLQEIVKDIFNVFFKDAPGHTFSMLYNAFTEQKFGERYQCYKGTIDKLHADSGGLQIITLGKTITPELMEEIFINQAKYADVGMCFDEIPVQTLAGSSDRNDTTGRRFHKEVFEDKARQTGENIKKQFEVYEKYNSNCKPFIILQGNSVDTYNRWAQIIFDILPEKYHDKIGGVALGAAALGTGAVEDVQRAFAVSQLPEFLRDENGVLHIHVLGVGSIRRMLPFLIFNQSGLYENVKISYDSTTHSRSVETGLYYVDEATYKFTRMLDNTGAPLPQAQMPYGMMLDDINTMYPLNITWEIFHKAMNTPSMKWIEEYQTLDMWIKIRTACVCKSIYNFMVHLATLIDKKEKLLKFIEDKAGGTVRTAYEGLYRVKNKDDFDKWMTTKEGGNCLQSAKIEDTFAEELEGMDVSSSFIKQKPPVKYKAEYESLF